MITAWIKDNEIIPYDAVEYVEAPDYGGSTITVHMAESKKSHGLLPDDAKSFVEGYKRFLELKEVMMGIIPDDDGNQVDPNQLEMAPTRRRK